MLLIDLSAHGVVLSLGFLRNLIVGHVSVGTCLASTCNRQVLLLLEHVENFHIPLSFFLAVIRQLIESFVRLFLLNFLRSWRVRLILPGLSIKAAHRACRHLSER